MEEDERVRTILVLTAERHDDPLGKDRVPTRLFLKHTKRNVS